MTIDELLAAMAQVGASDLHLKATRPPLVRLNGEIQAFELPALSGEDIEQLLTPIMSDKLRREFKERNEADYSYLLPGAARFRINMFRQKGDAGAVLRRIPLDVPTVELMGLPPVLNKLAEHENGLVLVTGPTGSGKSTTLAAMIEHVNRLSAVHIITIEDPIEFVYEDKMALINQRELGIDTETLTVALRAALRQDPDIILMGEMRDAETIRFGISAAETGHLVFATLHTNNAPQTLERILDIMPPEGRVAIRSQLSALLRGIVCQRLARRADGKGRVAALEILMVNETVRQLIVEDKISAIGDAMEDGEYYGMQTFNQALFNLVKAGQITEETSYQCSDDPGSLKLLYKGVIRGSGVSQLVADAVSPAAAPDVAPPPIVFKSEEGESGRPNW